MLWAVHSKIIWTGKQRLVDASRTYRIDKQGPTEAQRTIFNILRYTIKLEMSIKRMC